ncbi:tyrosine-type recombinase/integrase [Bacteroidia bacterium]|nr:tyrosine-type recombinase/integrase [Bacteroidia bacterium]
MATVKIILDRRITLEGDKHNVAVRIFDKKRFVDIYLTKVTERDYKRFMDINNRDVKSVHFRKEMDRSIEKAKKVYDQVGTLDRKKLKELFLAPPIQDKVPLISDVFDEYITTSEIAIKTKQRMRYSRNVVNRYYEDLEISGVTSRMLKTFERKLSAKELSNSTIASVMRDLRVIINYTISEKKYVLPSDYEYPFGKRKYSICSSSSTKVVLTLDETKRLVAFDEFNGDQKKLEYARDIWLLLYRCSGINFIDALNMKWTDIKNNVIVIFRHKTKNTTVYNKRPLTIPVTNKVQELLDKLGDKNSPYILGLLEEGAKENTIDNKSHKVRRRVNIQLRKLESILGLSVPLRIKTARETYITHQIRSGHSVPLVATMVGHSSPEMIKFYYGGMDDAELMRFNDKLA